MKKKLAIMALFILMVFPFAITPIYANYQSIGTGVATMNTATNWVTGIRQMESEGHGMGLTETINTTTGEATTTSNNIDVHMQKNTEYGAIVILGASEYGKQGEGENRYMNQGELSGTGVQASTTGNLYGIYEIGYFINNGSIDYQNTEDASPYEWTAAGGESFLTGIAEKYINRYTTYGLSNTDITTAKRGDATIETMNWHGNSWGKWLGGDIFGFCRGGIGAFAYGGLSPSFGSKGRAVAVVHVGV